ncbi:hypothetical protein Esti_000292 [Eimeria stiedai]
MHACKEGATKRGSGFRSPQDEKWLRRKLGSTRKVVLLGRFSPAACAPSCIHDKNQNVFLRPELRRDLTDSHGSSPKQRWTARASSCCSRKQRRRRAILYEESLCLQLSLPPLLPWERASLRPSPVAAEAAEPLSSNPVSPLFLRFFVFDLSLELRSSRVSRGIPASEDFSFPPLSDLRAAGGGQRLDCLCHLGPPLACLVSLTETLPARPPPLFIMFLLRLFFQVAVGLWGFLPAPCYPTQHRRVTARTGGPPWGPHGLGGDAADGAAAAGRTEEESAAAAPGEDRGLEGEPPPRRGEDRTAALGLGGPAHAAAADAQVPEQQQEQQNEWTSESSSSEEGGSEVGVFLGQGGEADPGGEYSSLYDLFSSYHTSDAPEGLKEGREEALVSLGPARGLSLRSRSSLSLSSLNDNVPLLGSERMRSPRGLAELLLQSPFGVRSFSANPRLKKAVEVHAEHLTSSAITMCGRRDQDEDTFIVDARPADSPFVVKALFDGHGGRFASTFCSSNLHKFLDHLKFASPENVVEAFLALDASLLQAAPAQHSGSTAVVALIEEVKEPRHLIVSGREVLPSVSSSPLFQKLDAEDKVGSAGGSPRHLELGGPLNPVFLVTLANVGDSRATLFHADGGGFTIMSRDHKPTNPEEQRRIEAAGGFVSVSPASVPRVDGILALSRAFGDAIFKDDKGLSPREQRVVAVPEVHTFYAVPGDVLMLACDGVYEPESMNWVFVSHFMLTLLHEMKNDLTEAGVKLLEHAYQSLSGDNISVLLTRFHEGGSFDRKVRRFQVTPEGYIVAAASSDAQKAHRGEGLSSIEAQKGPMRPTDENPITL